MLGLTSITFRKLSVEEVIRITKEANLDIIEWGSDVHVPAGDIEIAKKVKAMTEEAGLKMVSYGSYYKVGEKSVEEGFVPVLESAKVLGVANIRVWAGQKGSAMADEAYRAMVASELKKACALAKEAGINISLEYHRNTLTDTKESALSLLQAVNCDNFYTYWQPNPDISYEERLSEIALLDKYITNVHVFNWGDGNVRLPLNEGVEIWQSYIKALNHEDTAYIMEFVKGDSIEQFIEDAKALKEIVK